MMNLISQLSTFNGILPESDYSIKISGKAVEFWTGHNILSYIIPDIINIDMPNNSFDNQPIKEKNIVKIINGIIQQGTFDKNLFTKTSSGLIQPW